MYFDIFSSKLLMKKPTFKDPDVNISFRSRPLTDKDRKEISEFIAKEKKRLQQKGKIAST
jgi:hypothetical protein